MKKIISILIAVLMTASLAFTCVADYRGPVDGIDMSPGINPVVRLKSGTQFDYVIYARDMQGMTNGDFTVYYDQDVLTLSGVKTTGGFDSSYYNNVGGEIYFSYMYNDENPYDALKMYVLTFSYTQEGVYPTLEMTNLAGTFIKSVADVKVADGEDWDSDDSYDDGKTDSEQLSAGDVNGDGKVNAADARLALRISASIESVYLDAYLRADMDGDGDVTASDARTILRIAAGLES